MLKIPRILRKKKKPKRKKGKRERKVEEEEEQDEEEAYEIARQVGYSFHACNGTRVSLYTARTYTEKKRKKKKEWNKEKKERKEGKRHGHSSSVPGLCRRRERRGGQGERDKDAAKKTRDTKTGKNPWRNIYRKGNDSLVESEWRGKEKKKGMRRELPRSLGRSRRKWREGRVEPDTRVYLCASAGRGEKKFLRLTGVERS